MDLLTHIAHLLRDEGSLLRVSSKGEIHNYTCDADVIQEILQRPEDFPKSVEGKSRDPRRDYLKRTLGSGLATAHDDQEIWHVAHRILSPAMGFNALSEHIPKMQNIVNELVVGTKFRTKTISVVELMERVAFEIMAYVGFDTRFFTAPILNRVDLVQALREFLWDTWKGPTRRLPHAFHPLANRKRRRADAILATELDAIIQKRRTKLACGNVSPHDILGTMLTVQDKVTGKSLPDENIRHQLVTFLAASVETTAGALSYALHDLATHDHIEARLIEEVDRVLGPKNERPLMECDMRRLNYTERVFKEVLRLHPPGPIVWRHIARDSVLGGKYRVYEGERLAIFIPLLHRNPRYWQDSERFDPDRFLPAVSSARHPHAYHPFGLGMRRCIGFQFAMMEAKLILASLYQRFRPRLAGSFCELRTVFTDSAKPAEFLLRLEPRDHC